MGHRALSHSLGDSDLCLCDSFSGKMVLKRSCIGDTGDVLVSTYSSLRSPVGVSFKLFSWETKLWVDITLSSKVVLKRPCIRDTGEVLAVHIHCSGLLGDELQAVLLGDRALDWYDFKWPFGLEKTMHQWHGGRLCSTHSLFRSWEERILSNSPRRQSFGPFSSETGLGVDSIILLGRWSWKGCLSLTLGKPELCTFIVQVCGRQSIKPFSQDTEFWADIIVVVGRWYENAVWHWHWGILYSFVQVSWETEPLLADRALQVHGVVLRIYLAMAV